MPEKCKRIPYSEVHLKTWGGARQASSFDQAPVWCELEAVFLHLSHFVSQNPLFLWMASLTWLAAKKWTGLSKDRMLWIAVGSRSTDTSHLIVWKKDQHVVIGITWLCQVNQDLIDHRSPDGVLIGWAGEEFVGGYYTALFCLTMRSHVWESVPLGFCVPWYLHLARWQGRKGTSPIEGNFNLKGESLIKNEERGNQQTVSFCILALTLVGGEGVLVIWLSLLSKSFQSRRYWGDLLGANTVA